MNQTSLTAYMQQKKAEIDEALEHNIKQLQAAPRLKESMLYSISAGGKRIRPILLLATMEDLSVNSQHGMAAATALEMVHTYSLIHDDLPAMDDDDLRRGQPTNHKKFDESTAVLAGDALLTYSFQVLSRMPKESVTTDTRLALLSCLATAAGPEGMITGQMMDIRAENQRISAEELEMIHEHKTAKLLAAAVDMGALLAGATTEQREGLGQFSYHIGIAFQIRDDILDVEGSTEELGKNAGSDVALQKSTYPQLLTMKGAKDKLDDHMLKARQILADLHMSDMYLAALADYIVARSK